MKVLILQGGYNEEHKISLNTAKQIGKALIKLKIGFKNFTVNPNTFALMLYMVRLVKMEQYKKY